MTDSTPPSFPITPRAGESSAPLSRGEVALKILSASGDLQNLRRPTRIEGKVVKISRDGSTATIETEQGTVEVRLRERMPLQPGQKIEIDLPPGQPPRQLILRPAPAEPAPPQQAPTPQQPATPPPLDGKAPPPANAQRPLPPELRESLDLMAPLKPGLAPKNPAPLPADSIIRLIPLPAPLPASAILPLPVPLPSALAPLAIQIAVFKVVPMAGIEPAITIPSPPPQPLTATPPAIAQENWSAPLIAKPPTALQILPPAPMATAQTVLAAIPDFAPLQKFSLALPLIKQIQPFITPITPQPAPLPAQKFDMRVTGIEPPHPDGIPASTEKINAIPNSPQTITARVVATTTDHFPVLSMLWPGHDAPDSFTLQFPASNMPVGTQVELSPPVPALPGTAPAITGTVTPPFTLLTGWDWPAFDDALDLISPAGIQAQATQNFAHVLPSPAAPAQMPAAILFFMAAVGAGDLPGWMGEKAINALRREGDKGNTILQRLTRDFAGLSRMMDDPVSQDWKAMAIPMMWQNEVTKINLFYRHQDSEKNENQENSGERSTRFLFDLNLTRIGPLQLDGYMKAKRLDLIVRTKTPFSTSMQNDMRRLYADTLGKGQLTGELGFQNRLDQWVTVDVRQAEVQTSA